ncbi:uncharacterized protein LOC123541810 isoform X2 [Mercenaria mercenaria]|uniref:uncharacterized protein LOC123541810 isoform X2 n=1 Tax=Mercenaria mercenaria TaxID=6596 RepID=UPI00234E75A7|nr:uncharacterized protein LOC123541810 isoform X2 [Mercenaria mercenaria]
MCAYCKTLFRLTCIFGICGGFTSTDSSNKYPSWSEWGLWECHNEQITCVLYRYRYCLGGIGEDCEMIGSKSFDMKRCDDSRQNANVTSVPTLPTTTKGLSFISVVTKTSFASFDPSSVVIPFTKSSVTTTSPSTAIPIYWLEWTGWDCQETSGVCLMRKIRNCSTYISEDCEDKLGDDPYEVRTCRKEICPANWLAWGEWRCKMGYNGSCNMKRTRECSTGSTEACGLISSISLPCEKQVCPDATSCADASSCSVITDMHQLICQFKDTATKDCPKACGCCEEEAHWSEWSNWECQRLPNNTCRMKQTRKCSANNTNDCKGMSEVIAACSDSICPGLSTHVSTILPTTIGSISTLTTVLNSSQWSEWFYGNCSVSCGNGTTTRLRHCNTGHDGDCTGKPFETVPCYASVCPAQTSAQWSGWFNGKCSVSCGNGTTTRLRHCSTGNDEDCVGSPFETVPCTATDCSGLCVTSAFIVGISGFLLQPIKRYDCNFDHSMCAYQTSTWSHVMHWSWYHVSSSSAILSKDHTNNKDGIGRVLNVQASTLNKPGDTVRISSGVLSFPNIKYVSVGFWYNFNGTNPLTLKVYVNGSASSAAIYSKDGRYGTNRWRHGCATTAVSTSNIKVNFVAVVTHPQTSGSLAIDDVTVDEGYICHDLSHTSSTTTNYHVTTSSTIHATTTKYQASSSVSCDFESPFVCGYHQNSGDKFDWTRHAGTTISSDTGPNGDHTTGRGHYLYIEASSPRKPNETAIIESPSFKANGHERVLFWYNMYGNNIGALKVYLARYGVKGSPVFAKTSGSSSSIWRQACIDVTTVASSVQVVFEGVIGNGFAGDIAIDDVKLENGSCKTGTAVNGHWGSWSSYSACSVTCGVGHVTSRRYCNNPAPSNGGNNCTGNSTRQTPCHNPSCTVNAGWSTWSTWSKCSASCDLGTITRVRTCNSQALPSGGSTCTGHKTETHDCSLGQCPTWSHWFDGTCSSTCGNGTIERLRTCSTGTQSDCVGISTQIVPCEGVDCI